MAATLLLAPAGYGKTDHALARIRAVRAADPLAPIAVVLPNQIQLAAFRRRLASHGGALGVSLFTFYGLYAELLDRAGQPVPRLGDSAQLHLLRALVDDLGERGRLPYFGPIRSKPGFSAALREAFEELKRARIRAEDLAPAAAGLGPRLEELAEIYSAYQRWLVEQNWADPEGLGWLAAIALEQDAELGRDLQLLVVDGFDEFNPTQLAVLGHLADQAKETLVTLTGDHARRRLAHRRFHRAEHQLREALRPEVEHLAAQPETGPETELDYLESCLFEPPGSKDRLPLTNRHVEFLEAQTRALEARAALRWIKQRVVEDDVPLHETAILARSLDPYRAFIEECAREFGLPLHVVGGAPLAESPVVGALLTLLALPAQGWRPRLILEIWRSPYFDWRALGLDPRHAATLDSLARLGRVVGGLGQWRQAIARFGAPPLSSPDDEPESDAARPAPEAVKAAGQALEALVARLNPPPRAGLGDYVAFVENLVGDDPAQPASRFGGVQGPAAATVAPALNVAERALAEPATAARDLAALRALKAVLRGLMSAEAVVRAPVARVEAEDRRAWDYAAFLAALRQGVEAASYQTPLARFAAPGEGPGVMAASALDARGLSFRAVAILGLAEGEFPQAEREMPLLHEADRAALRARDLQLEDRLRADEVTIFYQAVTRARERLLLCRPYLADDGQQWEPSAYWRQARQLLGQTAVTRVTPNDRLPPQQVASAAEWIEYGYDAAAVEPGAAVLAARLAGEAGGPHEGQLPDLSQALITRYPSTQSWSASRLEAYGTCGFYFYVAHVLKLEPRAEPEEGYDARSLGSMYHAILERLYRDAPDPTDLDGLLVCLPGAAQAVFAAAPADYGFRPTAIWEQQQAELLRILGDTVAALDEKSEGWTPRHFEQRFGFGGPPLVVHTPDGEVRVHGYIDRVDEDAEGRLRVVDYKASGSPIAADDLEHGRRLQLPLYALAARDALQLGEVAEGFYWHIGPARASSLKLEKFEGGVAGALETAKRHLAAHVAGIRAGQFQPQLPVGGCPRHCPAVGFCWRYAPQGR